MDYYSMNIPNKKSDHYIWYQSSSIIGLLNEESFTAPSIKVNRNEVESPNPNNILTPFPIRECPKFDGENPRKWIEKCDKYFQYLSTIPEEYKVPLTSIYMEGRAAQWYREYTNDREVPSWHEFKRVVIDRFEHKEVDSEISERKHNNTQLVDDVSVEKLAEIEVIEVATKMFEKFPVRDFNELEERKMGIEVFDKMLVEEVRELRMIGIEKFNAKEENTKLWNHILGKISFIYGCGFVEMMFIIDPGGDIVSCDPFCFMKIIQLIVNGVHGFVREIRFTKVIHECDLGTGIFFVESVEGVLQMITNELVENQSLVKQLQIGEVPQIYQPIMEVLWLTETNLIGEIPDSLGQLGKLTDLDLAYNSLNGSIPSSLMELRSVILLELYNNSLSGELPNKGWSNMKSFRRLDASMNKLSGQIPTELCELLLESLNLYENKLRGELPSGIANSPNLYELRLFQNQLSGNLPPDLGKNSLLKWIDVSTNQFSGKIPEILCLNGALEEFLLIENSFSGNIPSSLGECRSLLRVRLGRNSFSGEVPQGFWGLPHVSLLELSGGIPKEIGFLDNLFEVFANDNKLSGSLPSSIVNLEQLVKRDLHDNEISENIPSGIHSWKKLNELNLANNYFSGDIPDEIGDLSVLNYFDLSGNILLDKIPVSLQNLKLNRLNLSNNHLSGDVLPLYAKEMYKESFLGNPGLCGDIEGLCDGSDRAKNMSYAWLFKSIFVLAGLVLIVGVIWFYMKYIKFKKAKKSIDRSKWTLMSFHKLEFSEDEILNALDEYDVIGSGASGKVYKVVLSSGEAVAVKKLWGRPESAYESADVEKDNQNADREFIAEIEMLSRLHHRNLVKLIGITPRLRYGQASSFITMEYSSGPLEAMGNRPFSGSEFIKDGLSLPIRHGNRSDPLSMIRSNRAFYRLEGRMGEMFRRVNEQFTAMFMRKAFLLRGLCFKGQDKCLQRHSKYNDTWNNFTTIEAKYLNLDPWGQGSQIEGRNVMTRKYEKGYFGNFKKTIGGKLERVKELSK